MLNTLPQFCNHQSRKVIISLLCSFLCLTVTVYRSVRNSICNCVRSREITRVTLVFLMKADAMDVNTEPTVQSLKIEKPRERNHEGGVEADKSRVARAGAHSGARGRSARGGARRPRRVDGLFEPLMLPIKHISVDNKCYPTLCRSNLVNNRSLFSPRDEDVIIATYPRSGTTWTLELVRQIHLTHRPDLPANHPLTTPDHKISAPWINNHNNMATRDLDSEPSPRVMKSHNHYCHVNLLPGDTWTKLVHVMRDPKDVLCSAYYHTLQVGPLFDYQGSFAEFVQFFLEGKVESGSYWDFNLQYLNNVNRHNILYLTYEDLSADKVGCVNKINSFLGYSALSSEQIDAISKATRFEAMKGTQRSLQGSVQGVPGQGHVMLSETDIRDLNAKTWTELQGVIDRIPPSYYESIVD